MPRFFAVVVTLIFSVGFALSQGVPLKKESPKEPDLPKFFKLKPVEINAKDDELLKLQKERVNILIESISFEAHLVTIGRANLFGIFDKTKQYLEARIEITPALADQLTLLTDYLEATKFFHKQIEVRVETGFEPKIGLLNWAAEVKWAEIEVLKLKRKIDAEKKKK